MISERKQLVFEMLGKPELYTRDASVNRLCGSICRGDVMTQAAAGRETETDRLNSQHEERSAPATALAT